MERQLHDRYHICSCGRSEIFDSFIAAAASVNREKSGISACIRGRQKTCGGYHWEMIK